MLSVRAIGHRTGCAAAWATIGAGTRADGSSLDTAQLCGTRLLPGNRPDRNALRAANHRSSFRARPGELGDALARAHVATAVVGDPGGWLGLADSNGDVGAVVDSFADPRATSARVLTTGDDSLYGISDAARPAALTALDQHVAVIVRDAGPDAALVVVGASDNASGEPHLHVAIAGWMQAGRLRSASTGRTDFVQLIDVAPTVLSLLRVPVPSAMAGRPWFSAASVHNGALGPIVSRFADTDRAATTVDGAKPRFYDVFTALVIGLFALAVLKRPTRGRTIAAFTIAAFSIAVLPTASFLAQLVPWWRAGVVAFDLLVFAVCLAVGTLACWATRRRGPVVGVAVVAGFVLAVHAVDIVAGTPLQLNAMLGDSPLLAGRFHGVGNIDFALVATAALLVAALAHRRYGLVGAGAVAVGALVLDGAPPLGDDLGGVLALSPAVGVLILGLRGVRVTWRRIAGAAVVGAVPLLAFMAYDYSLPTNRQSHVGRFVDELLHGGGASVTLHRKLATNLAQFKHPTIDAILLAALIVVVVLLRRGGFAPAVANRSALAVGFAAVAVAAGLGAVVNDSGPGVLVFAATVAVPLSIVLSISAPTTRPASG